jgi:hypothetical protein
MSATASFVDRKFQLGAVYGQTPARSLLLGLVVGA